MKSKIIFVAGLLCLAACSPSLDRSAQSSDARAMMKLEAGKAANAIGADTTIRIDKTRCSHSAVSAAKPVVAAYSQQLRHLLSTQEDSRQQDSLRKNDARLQLKLNRNSRVK